MLIELFMLSYVPADLFFIETHRTNTVSTRPEVPPGEVPFVPQQFPMDSNRTLPFQESDHHRNAVSRRHTQTQVDVVNNRFPFDQIHSSLSAQIPQNRSNPASRTLPYRTLCRYFGMNTTGYLHSHLTWDMLSQSCIGSPSPHGIFS